MNTQLTLGQTTHRQYGVLNVRIDRHHEGVTITTQIGPTYNATLSRTFTNAQLAEGRIFQAYLRDSANAGQPVWQIEAGVSAILAAAAVVDDAEQAMLEGINATLGEKRAELDAATEQARRNAAEVADRQKQTGGWWATRRTHIRPTATRVHCKPPTPAQLDRIRQHRNGRVTIAPGQPWTLLDGIIQRGYADEASIEYKPGTRQYVAVHLNRRGWAMLGQQSSKGTAA